MKTSREVTAAEREKAIQLIDAAKAAEREAIGIKVGRAVIADCHSRAAGFNGIGDAFYKTNPNFIDLVLGGFLKNPAQNGKFKVPTLRNIADAAPYGHNGYFKTLREVVDFYNTRDVPGSNWPKPEVEENLNTSELGNLGLTTEEVDAVVAFMGTLTDGYLPPNPREGAMAARPAPVAVKVATGN